MSNDRIGPADEIDVAMLKASTMSALLLACGEMTAQERRTARAVALYMRSVALAALRQTQTQAPDREAGERMREACLAVVNEVRSNYRPVLTKKRYMDYEIQQFFGGACGLIDEDIRALPSAQEGKPSC